MVPANLDELQKIRTICRSMVTRRAALSSGVSLMPVPGADLLADVGILKNMIPEINKRFGLSQEQIESLSPARKAFVYGLISSVGSKLIGKVITRRLLLLVLKRFGVRMAAGQAAKFVPVLGTVTSGVLNFGSIRMLGYAHIEDCYRVAEQMLLSREEQPVTPRP